MSVPLDTSHLERSPQNDVTMTNMLGLFVTLDTSHFEKSLLKNGADRNMFAMWVTLDTVSVEQFRLLEHVAHAGHLVTNHFKRSPLKCSNR